MANYQAIVRVRPEVRDFIRNRRWVHRGDVVSYGPNIRCGAFSTDAMGFRHSSFGGAPVSVLDCIRRDRYGVVLGPSSVYGFGLAGNEKTIPSLLADSFGFPFANVGLPEGNSRNLFSLLLAGVMRAPRPPAVVVHVSGGDFTSFCYTSMADPVFGSPNLLQIGTALKERGEAADPTGQLDAALAFSSTWIRAIGMLCRARAIPLLLVDDTTFFEKRQPSALDQDCALGTPSGPAQQRQFETHKRFVADYHACRKSLADSLELPLAGPGISNDLGFIDEFHYDAEGTRMLCNDIGRVIEQLI